MNIFKIYTDNLYYLFSDDKKIIYSKYNIEYEVFTSQNHFKVGLLRGKGYIKQFLKMLEYGDLGVFAKIDNDYVGYGWAKFSNSKDYFFKIDNCYLCRFYVDNNYRGRSIYPNIINWLIDEAKIKKELDVYFLAIEEGNRSSIKGATKVGFKYFSTYKFYRFLKLTFNKKKLTHITRKLQNKCLN